MWFTKLIRNILFLLFVQSICYGQKSEVERINIENLKRHLTFLSSDSLQGRSFTTSCNGLNIAADYIKMNAKEVGLSAVTDGYFQIVPVFSLHPDRENSYLEITGSEKIIFFKTDSIIGLHQNKNIEISNAEIIFAGFGFSDKKTGYDDFKDLDFRGKVAMFSMGTPDWFRKDKTAHLNYQLETTKAKRAFEAGAVGVIIIISPFDFENTFYNQIQQWAAKTEFKLESSNKNTDKNSFVFVTSKLADVIFGKSDQLKNLLSEISENNQPNSFKIQGIRTNIKLKLKTENYQCKNIVGVVEGSDPVLKNEYVVFMAHYDHLGIDENGEVFNGADDNGSGTVTLLEVARAFAGLNKKTKRSIVFLWVTGEEIGMFGSKYYVDNPLFPLEKTVACINVDMDGRVFEQRDSVWNKSPKLVKDFDGLFTLTNEFCLELKEINNKACKKLGLIPDYSLPSNFLRSSDHFSFHKNGVPILNYSTGYHADYHKVTDEVSRINFDKMKRIADLCFLVGLEIANQKTLKTFKK